MRTHLYELPYTLGCSK